MLDNGHSRIYRIDLQNGDCNVIGRGNLDCPVDVTTFGMFLPVLTRTGLLIFTHMGVLLKKYCVQYRSTPKGVTISADAILVIGENSEIYKFIIEIK